MTIMNRPRLRCLYVAVVAMACGVMPATQSTAGTTATPGMSGSAASVCNLSTTSVAVQVTRSGGTITFTPTPTNVTVFCNKPSGGTLSVASTQLQLSVTPNTKVNYTVAVSGWAASAVSYATGSGSPTTPAASTGSKATAATATLSFACTALCTTGNLSNGSTYNATITLGMTANP